MRVRTCVGCVLLALSACAGTVERARAPLPAPPTVKARPHATDATEIRRRFGELQAAALSDNGSDIARQVTVSTLARFDGVRLVARHAPSWVARNLPRADALAALVIRAERREHVADGAGALSLATRAGVRLVEGGPLRLPRRGRDPAG